MEVRSARAPRPAIGGGRRLATTTTTMSPSHRRPVVVSPTNHAATAVGMPPVPWPGAANAPRPALAKPQVGRVDLVHVSINAKIDTPRCRRRPALWRPTSAPLQLPSPPPEPRIPSRHNNPRPIPHRRTPACRPRHPNNLRHRRPQPTMPPTMACPRQPRSRHPPSQRKTPSPLPRPTRLLTDRKLTIQKSPPPSSSSQTREQICQATSPPPGFRPR